MRFSSTKDETSGFYWQQETEYNLILKVTVHLCQDSIHDDIVYLFLLDISIKKYQLLLFVYFGIGSEIYLTPDQHPNSKEQTPHPLVQSKPCRGKRPPSPLDNHNLQIQYITYHQTLSHGQESVSKLICNLVHFQTINILFSSTWWWIISIKTILHRKVNKSKSPQMFYSDHRPQWKQ